MKTVYDIILAPIVTEASMDGIEKKKYTFKVKVASVNTINMKKKPKRLGVHSGYTSEWKKAIVTLTADSKTIEFFDGMI